MALVKKISDLTAKSADLESSDLFAIAEDDGAGGYVTKKITGTEILDGMRLSVRSVSTFPHTLTLGDSNKFLLLDSSSANNTTIPPNSSIAFPIGMRIEITQEGTGQSRILAGVGVTLKSLGGADKMTGQYANATLIKTGTDEWYFYGSIRT
tara:strand:+ start:249 stop:704 length:456 start_codon:yes stop_codon:yes gene_type:complete